METEINALSHCCHELFPVLDMTINIGDAVGLPTNDVLSMSESVHEDNAGSLILAHDLLLQQPQEQVLRHKNSVVL